MASAKREKKAGGIILASSSPRRKRLLKKIAGKITVMRADVNERILSSESFPSAAKRLARAKAAAVAKKAMRAKAIVIGADTIAYFGKTIFRKTKSRGNAERILRALSGKTHTVVTGVAIVFSSGREVTYAVSARVKMKKTDALTLERYLKSVEWRGRAGCYDISGNGGRLVERVVGEKETVAGLPLKRLRKEISSWKRG